MAVVYFAPTGEPDTYSHRIGNLEIQFEELIHPETNMPLWRGSIFYWGNESVFPCEESEDNPFPKPDICREGDCDYQEEAHCPCSTTQETIDTFVGVGDGPFVEIAKGIHDELWGRGPVHTKPAWSAQERDAFTSPHSWLIVRDAINLKKVTPRK